MVCGEDPQALNPAKHFVDTVPPGSVVVVSAPSGTCTNPVVCLESN
jgi:hypothetical protein